MATTLLILDLQENVSIHVFFLILSRMGWGKGVCFRRKPCVIIS